MRISRDRLMLLLLCVLVGAGVSLSALTRAAGEAKQRLPEERSEDNEGEAERDTSAAWVAGVPVVHVRGMVRPFQVRSRKDVLENFPCTDCHEDEPPNPRKRKLTEEHEELVLDHGAGRFWCMACHGGKDKDALSPPGGEAVDFDRSYITCGRCHSQRQKDWYLGGHGKRISGWAETRRIAACPECHDAHSPSIKPFKPDPPPLVRKGLKRRGFRARPHRKPWSRSVIQMGRE